MQKNHSSRNTGTGITGTAYFQVENGVPTLYLDGVTVNDGYKESDFLGGSIGYLYNVYGIYYKPAGDDKLTVKLSGTNVIEPEHYTDEKHQSSRIYGIMFDKNCTEFSLDGGENTKLSIVSEYKALYGKSDNCVISINGGEYDMKTTGTVTSSEGIYIEGSLKVENAKVNIVSESDRGIWILNRSTSGGITSVTDSSVTIKAGIGEDIEDGILSENDMTIRNSIIDIECDAMGIQVSDGKSLDISGADTVVSVKSIAPVRTNWDSEYAAIRTEESNGYYEEGGLSQCGDITLNDGLAVTTPDAGKISGYDFDHLTPEDDFFAHYKTVIDADGSYAREVVIKTPTEHCVCGTEGCTSHTGTIAHIADNSLNLIEDIATNETTLTSGSYYLSDDLALTRYALTVSGTVNICLNGHKLAANFENVSSFL